MKIQQNQFKARLKAGEKQYGMWNGIPHTYVAEICAGSGLDFICIDGEHGPFDLPAILVQLQAMQAHDVSAMVRIPVGEPYFIKQYLDLGAQTILVPMIETADQARKMVEAATYPPDGIRGIGSGLARAAQWNRVDNYFAEANDQVCLILQIESVAGIENLDAILEVPGFDGVIVGPADLAGSMGHLGQPGHPEVVSTIEKALTKIANKGLAAGFLTLNEELIKKYTSCGATIIAVGVDTIILAKGSQALAEKFKNA